VSATDTDLLSANSAFYEALERGDLDALTALWMDGDEPVCVHPGLPPIHGAKAVIRSWAAILASTPYLQFVLTDLRASRSGDVGVVSCTENLLSAPEGMPDTMFAGGRAVATNVFRYRDGRWRMWAHHASSVAQPDR
jgi:ketosteroid isomerase-like protein